MAKVKVSWVHGGTQSQVSVHDADVYEVDPDGHLTVLAAGQPVATYAPGWLEACHCDDTEQCGTRPAGGVMAPMPPMHFPPTAP